MPDLTLDLRNLRYALLAADRGSFRRAAAELGVEQSTVSRRIQQLEHRLGAAIFDRHPGGVRLTPAGRSFLRDAAEGTNHFRRAIEAFTSAARGCHGELRIGLFLSLASGFLAEIIEQYVAAHGKVEIRLEESNAQRNISRVLAGDLDVAFVAGTPTVKGCATLELWQERFFVALPSKHTLAGKADLCWEDIRQERFILSEDGSGPDIHDYLITRLSRIGFHPDIRLQGVGRENLMNMVARGFGLTLTTASTVTTTFSGVIFRPINNIMETVPCCALWSCSNSNPALKHFLAAARAAAHRADHVR